MTKDIEREAFAALPEVAKLYQACKERDLTIAEREYLKGARDAWQAAKAHQAEKLKGCVVVPVNNTTIVAIEKMVEQQVEASGITDDVFRLDGEKILNAMLKAARGGNE